MKKSISLALAGMLMLPLAAANAADTVKVCHRPPGNPDKVHIIAAPKAVLPILLANGDHMSFGGFCYVVQAGDQNVSDSEQACIDQFGGHLASIHSLAEDNFISQLVDPDATGGIFARIGGDDLFCSGPFATYAWTDNTAWDFTNWRDGEPNCSGNGFPASIQFWPNTNGVLSGWNDTPSEVSLTNFVCKYEP